MTNSNNLAMLVARERAIKNFQKIYKPVDEMVQRL